MKFMNQILSITCVLVFSILLGGNELYARQSDTGDPFKRDPIFTRSIDDLFGYPDTEGDTEGRDPEEKVRYLAYRGIDLGGSFQAGPYQSSALYSQYPNLPMIHYNRVNGLFLGLQIERMQWYRYNNFLNIPGIAPHGSIGWGTASRDWEYAIGAEKKFGKRRHLMIGAEYHKGTATEDFGRVGLNETSVTAFLAGYDFPDYYKMEGFGLYTLWRTRKWLEAGFSWSRNTFSSLPLSTDYTLFGKRSTYRPNPAIDADSDEIDLDIYAFSVAFNPRTVLISDRFTFAAKVIAEFADNNGSAAEYRFNKVLTEAKMFFNLEPGSLLSWRIQAGGITGTPPDFKQFYLGGIGTLRGSPYKFFNGNQMIASNLEVKLGRPSTRGGSWINDYHLHLLLFLDSGWTQMNEDLFKASNPYEKIGQFSLADMQHDFGIGIGTGALRAELAWPLKTFGSSPIFWIRLNPTF